MKTLPLLLFEIILTAAIVIIGISNKTIWFIQGARSAAITLGTLGMLLCAFSIGKFLAIPSHPLTIISYVLTTVVLLAFATQIFRWNLPVIASPTAALFTLAGGILAKGIIARFAYLLDKQGII